MKTCMAYIYYGFNARCINMYMSLNGAEHIYTVTARLHKMGISCQTYQYAYEFEQNITYVYYYDWFTYDDL